MQLKKTFFLIFIAVVSMITQDSCKKHILDQIEVTPGTFTDPRDEHVYKTTTFGDATWLAENLDFETDSGSCYYDNDPGNHEYGRLYSYYVATAAVPPGWHLPTLEDIHYLNDNFGGAGAAAQVKEQGTSHWINNYSSTTNYSGLTLIPGGKFDISKNEFKDKGFAGNFWKNQSGLNGYYVDDYHSWIDGYSDSSSSYQPQKFMYSIRCVKNK
ncbi:MAG: FISUMP domain-containing protein [Bacteroidota bacterium]